MPPRLDGMWMGVTAVTPETYVCGYCGDKVGPDRGYSTNVTGQRLLICSSCNCPTFIARGAQVLAPAFGADVKRVPGDIKALYDEARNCMSVANLLRAALIFAIAVTWVSPARAARASDALQPPPSMYLTGKLVQSLQDATKFFEHREGINPQLRDYIIQVWSDSERAYVEFIPQFSDHRTRVAIMNHIAEIADTIPSNRTTLPTVLPGIIVERLLAIIRFGSDRDSLQNLPWFIDGDYTADLEIGAGSLVAGFRHATSRPNSASSRPMQCLSGCNQSWRYILRLQGGSYTIEAIRTL